MVFASTIQKGNVIQVYGSWKALHIRGTWVMKIYIVHENGGEYEDEWDNILGVFTTLKKAQELRDRKKKENDEYSKKVELAYRIQYEEITLEQSGLSKEEYESYCDCDLDDYMNYYYITQITLDKESREESVNLNGAS